MVFSLIGVLTMIVENYLPILGSFIADLMPTNSDLYLEIYNIFNLIIILAFSINWYFYDILTYPDESFKEKTKEKYVDYHNQF